MWNRFPLFSSAIWLSASTCARWYCFAKRQNGIPNCAQVPKNSIHMAMYEQFSLWSSHTIEVEKVIHCKFIPCAITSPCRHALWCQLEVQWREENFTIHNVDKWGEVELTMCGHIPGFSFKAGFTREGRKVVRSSLTVWREIRAVQCRKRDETGTWAST